MDAATALRKYRLQRRGAFRRGIEWRLTFTQWVEWWGDDLDRRGSGATQLQMQRKLDTGPYALDNIVKGVPKQNQRTRAVMQRNRNAEAAKIAHQAALDALPVVSADEDQEDESIGSFMSRDPVENPKRLFG